MILINHIAMTIYFITILSLLPHTQTVNSCTDEIIGDKTILESLEVDLDADGFAEEVIIYEDKGKYGDSVSFLAILSPNIKRTCQVLFDYELKGEPENQNIHTFEIKEITMEGIPEIYIAYDIDRGSYRSSFAYQYVFGFVNDEWQEIFINEDCLIHHYFEFRENPNGTALAIYTEDDLYCDVDSVSSYAEYTLYEWDGDRYEFYEQGNSTPHLDELLVVRSKN
ncbi:MAG: hypothetical protein R6X34_05620 [Chloroflexota bacterium]